MDNKPIKKRNRSSSTWAIIGWLFIVIMIVSYCTKSNDKPKRTQSTPTKSTEEIARQSARYIDCQKNRSTNYCECLVIGAKKKVDWSDWVAWLDGASPINADTRAAITKLTYNCQGL